MLEHFKDRKLILYPEPVNLRKVFQGLNSLCPLTDLFTGDVYIFINRRHKLLKALKKCMNKVKYTISIIEIKLLFY